MWQGGASVAALSPTTLGLAKHNLKYCKSSTVLVSCKESEIQKRKTWFGPYPRLQRELEAEPVWGSLTSFLSPGCIIRTT